MTRKIKRGGKVWINNLPAQAVTKKAAETRMGKGKGSPEDYVAVVKPGRVMFEMSGVNEELARDAMRLAAQKLPIQTPSSFGEVFSSEGSRGSRAGRGGIGEAPRRYARELFNLRFQHATGQLDNTGQLKEVRKNIARILTVLNQKQQER